MSNCNSLKKLQHKASNSYDGPILSFKTSKPNKSKMAAVFKDDDDNNVKEYLHVFQNGEKEFWSSFTSRLLTLKIFTTIGDHQ
jgi:hypothetical protein